MRANITDEIYVPVKYNKKFSEYRAVLDSHGKARYYTSEEMAKKYCTEKFDDVLVYYLSGFVKEYKPPKKSVAKRVKESKK